MSIETSLSSKSQNTLTPDPDFVVSDSYPKGVSEKILWKSVVNDSTQ